MADDVGWDGRKAAANLRKHGIDFADAATVLHDDQAITIRDDEAGEERQAYEGQLCKHSTALLVGSGVPC